MVLQFEWAFTILFIYLLGTPILYLLVTTHHVVRLNGKCSKLFYSLAFYLKSDVFLKKKPCAPAQPSIC